MSGQRRQVVSSGRRRGLMGRRLWEDRAADRKPSRQAARTTSAGSGSTVTLGAGRSADAESHSARSAEHFLSHKFISNEGEAECFRVVEATGTTLTAHKMERNGWGRAGRIRAQRALTGRK